IPDLSSASSAAGNETDSARSAPIFARGQAARAITRTAPGIPTHSPAVSLHGSRFFSHGAATVRPDTADRKLDLSHSALASAVSPGKIATQGDLRQKVRMRPLLASLPCTYTSG